MDRSLAQQMCRTAGIFQAITALPTMLFMGESAWEQLYYPYIGIYRFITATCTGLMAAGVVFIISIQRHPKNTKTSTYYLEIVKSSLASALWLWLFLDSIFAEQRKYYTPQPGLRFKKIVEAALCFFLLPILFYPTLAYSIYDRKSDEAMVPDEENQSNERQPLLSRPSA